MKNKPLIDLSDLYYEEYNGEYKLELIDDIYSDIIYATNSNNYDELKKVLESDKHISSLVEREKTVFSTIYSLFKDNKDDRFIRYLIFDYKITEKNSLDIIENESPKKADIKDLFTLREINNQLHSELDSNKKNTKKIKV